MQAVALVLLASTLALASAIDVNSTSDKPNIVIFALDGGIEQSAWDLAYKSTILPSNARSPNGCRVPMTWFTVAFLHGRDSGDCQVVRQAFELGHEMATHTMVHSEETLSYSYDEWASDIGGQRDWLVQECGIPYEEVVGFRAPNFRVNNLMGRVLADLEFGYDSSLSGFPWTEPGWLNGTFNLTTCLSSEEERAKCGEWGDLPLWEVPAYLLPGSFRRTDPAPVDGMSVVERLQADFERKWGSGIPVTLNIHERYLLDSENMDAVIEFFRWAAAQPGETWFLTYQQYKQWWEAGQPSVEQVTLRYPCDDT